MLSSRAGRFRVIGLAVSIAFAIANALWAQLPTATILGTVRDSSGAAVPGAQLTARNMQTDETRTTVSQADGSYRFDALPVGRYEVHAEHEGFQTEVRSGLLLEVTQEAVVNITLQVGQVQQTVSVTAEAPLVNTTSGSLGGLVNTDQMANLPLNGRNFSDLILLEPGITNNNNKGAGGSTNGLTFVSNGATLYSNNYLIDGTSMNQQYGGSAAGASGNTLGVEGIEEYKVVTNSFSAEYGMTMGSQMLIVTKSGTNTFHGSLFEYLRNSALDARNFYDYTESTSGLRLPPFRRNNFGGALGGPVIKNKTFFFFTYEALKQRTGITTILTTLPASARVNGGVVPQIASVIQPFLQYFPLPNLPNNQYTYPYTRPDSDSYTQGRIDQILTSSDTLFGRYTIDTDRAVDAGGWPQWHVNRYSRNQYLTLSENHTFSFTVVNTFRASFSRTVRDQGFLPTDLNVAGPQYSFVPGYGFGAINIGGLTANFGPSVGHSHDATQNIFAESDDIFVTRGRHALKFGTLINRYQMFSVQQGEQQGTITFPSVASFLLGEPSTYSAETPGSTTDRTYYYTTAGFYGEDDMRLSSRFTLNLGLRYEFNTTYREEHNRGVAIINPYVDATTTIGPPFRNPSLLDFSPRIGFAWDIMGDHKTSLRGGAAKLFDIGGLGYPLSNICAPPLCNTETETIPVSSPVVLTLPFTFPQGVQSKTLSLIDYNLTQPHIYEGNLTLERELPGNMAVTVAYSASRGIDLYRTVAANPPQEQIVDGLPHFATNSPRINPNWGPITLVSSSGDSWYHSLQTSVIKRLSHNVQFQISYTWQRAIDDIPQSEGGSETTQALANLTDPYSNKVDKGLSNFNIASSLKFNLIYRPPNPFANPRGITKILSGWQTSWIYTLQSGLPFSPTVGSNISNSLQGSDDRPDLLPGYSASSITSGTTGAGCPGVAANLPVGNQNLWYNPCAFALQANGFLGNVGRNILQGPGINNLDFSISKETSLPHMGERAKLRFQADFFNIFNHANFAPPALGSSGNPTQLINNAAVLFSGTGTSGAIPMSTAGVITQTSTTSRQIQLGLRFSF